MKGSATSLGMWTHTHTHRQLFKKWFVSNLLCIMMAMVWSITELCVCVCLCAHLSQGSGWFIYEMWFFFLELFSLVTQAHVLIHSVTYSNTHACMDTHTEWSLSIILYCYIDLQYLRYQKMIVYFGIWGFKSCVCVCVIFSVFLPAFVPILCLCLKLL